MRKHLLTLFIIVLVAVIAIQSYLLYKKGLATIETKPDEPKVTINIQKSKPLNSQPTDNTTQPKALNAEKLEHDIKKIFQDILGSKEVQDGLITMREQFQDGIQKAQKEMDGFLKEFDTMVKDDAFFEDVFKNLGTSMPIQFEDKNDHYFLKLPVPKGKESKVNIKTKSNLLVINIEKEIPNDNYQSHTLVVVPPDALIDEMKTKYKNGMLEITVPKIM